MPVPVETCEACRFDGAQYDRSDALGTLRALAPMWEQTIEGTSLAVLEKRPAPGVWSAVEYLSHSADVIANMGRLLHATLTIDDLDVGDVPEPTDPDPEPLADGLARYAANARRLQDKAATIPDGDPAWSRTRGGRR